MFEAATFHHAAIQRMIRFSITFIKFEWCSSIHVRVARVPDFRWGRYTYEAREASEATSWRQR